VSGVPRRVKPAPAVVTAPLLVEEGPASPHAIPVVREASARAGDDGGNNPASAAGSEPRQLAEAEDGDASSAESEDGEASSEEEDGDASRGAEARATDEQAPARDEAASAATEAPARAGEPSEEPNRVALVPVVEPEQPPGSDSASEALVNEGPGE
jgi:hypothetical protein